MLHIQYVSSKCIIVIDMFIVYQAHAHYKFGALSVCLAVNYLDRFLSLYEMPVSLRIHSNANACL